MFGIGETEFALILIFGFLLFGPDKLPGMGRTIGRGLRQFREAQEGLTKVVKAEVIDPINDAANGAPSKKGAVDDDDADLPDESDRKPTETFAERKARLAAEAAAAEKDGEPATDSDAPVSDAAAAARRRAEERRRAAHVPDTDDDLDSDADGDADADAPAPADVAAADEPEQVDESAAAALYGLSPKRAAAVRERAEEARRAAAEAERADADVDADSDGDVDSDSDSDIADNQTTGEEAGTEQA